MGAEQLASWRDGPAKRAITAFVARVTGESGARAVPIAERVAVFDNDGTLWCERPAPIQADFIMRRLREMAAERPDLRDEQPWRSAWEGDFSWVAGVIAAHYAGDDSDLPALAGGILAAHGDMSVDEFEAQAGAFLRTAEHPSLGIPYAETTYGPMVDLLRHLETHGFTCYIASGGGRDFMRPVTEELYGVPRERVIGSAGALTYVADGAGGTIVRRPELDYVDDGPAKPVRIWSRTGRRPLLAAGNSNGDIPMLEFAHHADVPSLRLLILHDDDDREFAYTAGAETAVERAHHDGWTSISMKDDWSTVF